MKKLLLALALIPTLAFGITKTEQSDMEFKGKVNLGSEISATPATSTATGNVDALPTTGIYQLRLTGAAPTIRGIANGYAGKELLLINATGAEQLIKNNDPAVTAGNRILTGTGDDLEFPQDAAFRLVYDMVSARWRIAGGGGAGGTEILAVAPIEYDPDTTELSIPPATNAADGYMPKEQVQAVEDHETRLDAAEPAIVAAQADADAAQSTANTAVTNAATAQTTANNAASAAATADAKAVTADGKAVTADGKAVTAQNTIDAHLIDAVDAHDGSAISIVASKNLSGADVQAVLAQMAQNVAIKNYVQNPGAEVDASTGITATNTTVTRNTTSPILGAADFSFTIDSATDVVEFALDSFDAGLKNDVCEVSGRFSASANGENVQVQLYRNSVAVGSKNLWTNSDPQEFGIYAPCGDLTNTTTLRVVGTAATTTAMKLDDLQVTKARYAKTPLGGTWVGRIKYAATSNCTWQNGSGSYANNSANSNCPNATAEGSAIVPTAKTPSVRVDVQAGDNYKFVVTSDIGLNGSSVRCSWRMSDGTDSSNAGTQSNSGSGGDRMPRLEFNLNPTSSGVKEYHVQSKILSGTSCDIYNGLTDQGDFTIDVYRYPREAAVLTAAAKTGDYSDTRYEPTIQGQSAYSVSSIWHSRTADKIRIHGYFQSTGNSGVEMRIPLPGNLVADPTIYPAKAVVGTWQNSGFTSDPTDTALHVTGGDSYLTVGYRNASNGIMAAQLANAIVGSPNYFHFDATISIKGWTRTAASANITGEPGVWSGYFQDDCNAWIRSGSTTLGDFATDSSCTLTERQNQNFGTVVKEATGYPGYTLTPKQTGRYMICSTVIGSPGNGEGVIELRQDNATTVFRTGQSSNNYFPMAACGVFSTTAGVATTLKFRGATSGSQLQLSSMGVSGNRGEVIETTIFPITQNLPGFFGGGASQMRTFAAQWGGASATSGCSSSPCNTFNQTDSEGNTDTISAITRRGTGQYTMAVTSGRCSGPAYCSITNYRSCVGNDAGQIETAAWTSTGGDFVTDRAAATNGCGIVQCSCKK